MREKSTTMLFNYAITDAATNPFKMATPFGPPVTIQQGDLFAKCDEQERLLEEAAEVLRNLCTAIDAEADLGRPFPERYPRTIKGVRAILAKLEARDA